MAVAGIGAYPVDGDEERALDAKQRCKVGVLDHLQPQRPRLGIGAGIGQRPRPADGIVDRLAVEGDEGTDADLGRDQPAAGQFLEALADRVAADGKALDELVLALQAVAEAENAGADFMLENGSDLLGLARAGRQLNCAPLHMGTCSVNLYDLVHYPHAMALSMTTDIWRAAAKDALIAQPRRPCCRLRCLLSGRVTKPTSAADIRRFGTGDLGSKVGIILPSQMSAFAFCSHKPQLGQVPIQVMQRQARGTCDYR